MSADKDAGIVKWVGKPGEVHMPGRPLTQGQGIVSRNRNIHRTNRDRNTDYPRRPGLGEQGPMAWYRDVDVVPAPADVWNVRCELPRPVQHWRVFWPLKHLRSFGRLWDVIRVWFLI
jgi:hypothetical protein